MALRYFHPISESTELPVPAVRDTFDYSRNQLIDVQAGPLKPGPVQALDIHNLALEMELARKKLLDLLMKNPLAHSFLIAHLSDSNGDGADYSFNINEKSVDEKIDQHIDLAKSHFTTNSPLQSKNQFFVVNGSESVRPEDVHFFPAFLIRIADRTLHTDPNDFAHNVELAASRHHLQDIRQRMIAANTGLVAFLAHKYKSSA
jgi:RNA polymerase primary sigma factor